jgi:ankyrin repeat protein
MGYGGSGKGKPFRRAVGEELVTCHKQVVELLIAKGADVNPKLNDVPHNGKTPLDAANETNHPETADLLGKHGGKTGEELKAEGK